jgi:hypothetical protein
MLFNGLVLPSWYVAPRVPSTEETATRSTEEDADLVEGRLWELSRTLLPAFKQMLGFVLLWLVLGRLEPWRRLYSKMNEEGELEHTSIYYVWGLMLVGFAGLLFKTDLSYLVAVLLQRLLAIIDIRQQATPDDPQTLPAAATAAANTATARPAGQDDISSDPTELRRILIAHI